MTKNLSQVIENAFEQRLEINPDTSGGVRDAVNEVLALLDCGKIRICEKSANIWQVNQWIKKAILLSFRLNDNFLSRAGGISFDKMPLKFSNWNDGDFRKAGFRALPGSVVRYSAFIAKNVILMPSFVNLGAYVDEGTMVDTWATIGSCAQIGKNCHISGGAGIGGVLEPLQANPVIIEDDCFIGARSEIAEGVVVEKGAVISMGVYIGASTKIIDRESGEVFYGRVPSYSVVVPGSVAAVRTSSKSCCAESEMADLRASQRSVLDKWRRCETPSNIPLKKPEANEYIREERSIENSSFTAGAGRDFEEVLKGEKNISLYAAIIVKKVDEKTRSKTSINELLRG